MAAILLILGNAIQAGAVTIAMFLVGRYITGVGVGMLISNTPVYLSEIAPAHSRGLLVGLQGNFIIGAYVLSSAIALDSYFVDASLHGVSTSAPRHSWGWCFWVPCGRSQNPHDGWSNTDDETRLVKFLPAFTRLLRIHTGKSLTPSWYRLPLKASWTNSFRAVGCISSRPHPCGNDLLAHFLSGQWYSQRASP